MITDYQVLQSLNWITRSNPHETGHVRTPKLLYLSLIGAGFCSRFVNKIIFINRYFYPDLSATSQMLSDLAFALARDASNVCVVTSRQTYEDSQARLSSHQIHAGVDIRRIWTTRFGRMNLVGRIFDYLSFYAVAFLILLRVTQPGDVIVAKTDPPLISVIAWIVAKVKRAKLINWLQDIFPEVAVALGVLTFRPLVGLIRWLRNLSLKGAMMNVVLGERMRDCICEQGIARTRTTIIHNWADSNLIKPVSRTSNGLREAWKLQEKFVVGYSGNMGRAHEFNTIIGAMRRLRDDKSIVFLFIGGGAEKAKLERAVGESGLTNCVFQPYQSRERLGESLSVSDVHLASLQPSLEGLIVPSKIYGIAASARPVIFIGDPEGEVGRLVARCQFGFTIRPGEDGELAERLRDLKRFPEVAASFGNNGRRCLIENFEQSKATQAWKSVLAGLTQQASV
jgi:colanic acid biosynthesis glycosyl transferase WcaI